jgi:hypothetical protein
MRTAIAILLLCLTFSARAREWKSELFHCAANIPDSGGWQIIEAPQSPGIASVITMQHTLRQSVFGINIVEKYRDANLADPAIQKDLEGMMRQFGYQFIGHSTVRINGLDWLLYPVTAGSGPQAIKGIIRFASAGGYVFCITLLRGGGQEVAQDPELQQAAASFRVLPATAIASTAPPPTARVQKPANGAVEQPAEDGEAAEDGGNSKFRWVWYAVGGLFILSMFFGIIGHGRAQKR